MPSHMGYAGSAYPRFQRALTTGNLQLIRAAAARTFPRRPRRVCNGIPDAEPERLERSALRWLDRYAVEKTATRR